MTAPAFTWTPSYTTTGSRKPQVRSAKFGDGYEQRTRDGINNNPRTWNIVCTNYSTVDADAVMAFLDGLGGADMFTWTDPDGKPGQYTCRDYTRSYDDFNANTINAVFVENFDL